MQIWLFGFAVYIVRFGYQFFVFGQLNVHIMRIWMVEPACILFK